MSCDSPVTKWSTAERDILEATYKALLKHGYAEISITSIGAELDKSKSSIYHHYNTKTALLTALLKFTVDQFMSRIETNSKRCPDEELDNFLEQLLTPDPAEELQLQTVLVCFRSQAVTNQDIRAQFTQVDQRLAATLQDIIARGIKNGVFRDVDVSQVTENILAMANGVITTRLTTDREDVSSIARESVVSYVESELKQSS